ncbi:pancreatic lipase-related protein 2-like [Ostrinia furnacalis]|uniref:pancreatic lipase-related protein 2-like n=1 Tax=Ostrinia furnacalis TaxID=93504 RepID=UPI00103F1D93|nr:pancreatic lipase-related protein 2-like [Ostrinia furnacalis]
MWTFSCLIFIGIVALGSALPAGSTALLEDAQEGARYSPATANAYHLFSRANPSLSQPLLNNNAALLQNSNYSSDKKTVVLIHGWRDNAVSDFNTVVVAAYLAAEDVNVIVVDWSAGATAINTNLLVRNTVLSAGAVANFIEWLNEASGSTLEQYHIIGHGVGGHQAAMVSRNLGRGVAYLTGLDPSLIGWANNLLRFRPNDAVYTEVIHTNTGVNGFLADIAHADFYPNGGISMPGCNSNSCDHDRSFFYFAESLGTGGFTGQECINFYLAVVGACNTLPGRLEMGGLEPKTGRRGVFWLETNAAPPFSQD